MTSREKLKKVPRLGAKAFVQAAGFLRIFNGKNRLDASAIHPESYDIVEHMASDLGCQVANLLEDETLREKIDLNRYVTDRVGMPTLTDIMAELAKPGRDPREQFESFGFTEGIEKLEDLQPGMKLSGVVTNVTGFGAFVDIGVHQDGLVHVSKLADRFVKDPHKVVKVNQKVTVTVLGVDLERKRISLSLREKSNLPDRGNTKSNLDMIRNIGHKDPRRMNGELSIIPLLRHSIRNHKKPLQEKRGQVNNVSDILG